ncbi:hypothetical protein HYY73_05040 [Candidatus Woesearchaeota archaeon]|nr:hypothetical protein [Candidatus Woesearchaeota archaeon]
MVTVSAIAKKLVNEKPLLQEGLRQGIISFAALAEIIKPQVAQQLGKEASLAAVIMALRRHSENLRASDVKRIKFEPNAQLTLKTNLIYFSVKRSRELFRKLEGLYKSFDYETGDTFNVIHGNYEVSIITNGKYEKKVAAMLAEERITTKEKNLVSISLSLAKDFVYTPGIIFAVTRKLYWDNINVFELVTTATELTFIFQKKDSMRAYSSMQELIEEKTEEKNAAANHSES